MNRIVLLFVLVLVGCASGAMRTPEPLEEGQTDREFIVLRTGQTCEIKDAKIIACERNTFQYAENKADIEAMKEKEKEEK